MKLRPHQQRTVDAMAIHSLGQSYQPTGSGKTICMIADTLRAFENSVSQTVVVVAPRIGLALQLCSEFMEHIMNASVFHVHSGHTPYHSSTNPDDLYKWAFHVKTHKLIFTTYHSLHRVVESGIQIDTIYFDEAHHSVKKSFFEPTKILSQTAKRCYFFTATPKYSQTASKPGMNWSDVYGKVISKVTASELVEGGFIIPPVINVNKMDIVRDKDYAAEYDCMTLLDTILNEDNMQKVLVAAPNTKVLIRMIAETDFMTEIQSHGYDVLWITSKYGAFINNKKVSRTEFFDTLNEWGKDNDRKFILLHYSILSEGINVSGLTACVLMRNMDNIGLAQTIGRVIRLHQDDARRLSEGTLVPGDIESYTKSYGFIHVPVYSNVGIATARRLQSVVETIFLHDEPAVSVIKK
jgi:superfamily II DNA or RNA helicase